MFNRSITVLKLLTSVAKITKGSKSMVQLHRNKLPEIAESLIFFNRFPVRFETPTYSATPVKKW